MISKEVAIAFYTLCPQILGASIGLLVVFIQMKINEINDHLVGDGKAVYKRKIDQESKSSIQTKTHENGYEKLSDEQKLNLQDAIERKDLYNIEEVLKFLSEQQPLENLSERAQQRGFKALLDRFQKMKEYKNEILTSLKEAIIFSFITIFFSLTALFYCDIIFNFPPLSITVLAINLALVLISILLILQGVFLGLREKMFNGGIN